MIATTSRKKAFYANATAKPKPVPLAESGIPPALLASARWVPWFFSWKANSRGGGKWDKVPLSSKTGRVSDCANPRSWGTYRQARNWTDAGTADGVGLALGDGLAGIDLDDHRDPDTGTLTPFAQRVLVEFASYAETSPSGTGIKILGRGKFPFDGAREDHRPPGVELFNGGYFAITGNALPGAPADLQDLQPAIDAHLAAMLRGWAEPGTPSDPGPPSPPVVDSAGRGSKVPTADEVERRVRSHGVGEALMNGDTRGHGEDASRADLALCNLLAFYSAGRVDLIDAVFRRSGLMRPKWDEPHYRGGETYGAHTAGKALAGKREFFDWDGTITVTVTGIGTGEPGPAPQAPPEPPWPEMGAAAYHGLAGEFVRLVEPHTEADPVALLVQFLAMFGSAAGREPFVRAERTPHRTNEFVVLVGRSAKGRKGTSEGWPSELLRLADPEWAARCRAGKFASGEALVWAIRDPIYKSEDGATVCVDDGVPDKRLLVTEGEFSVILKIAGKETNTLSDLLRDAWDGKDLHNKSKVSPGTATGPHVSVIGHTTESDLRLLLTENAMCNGFGNRFLFFAVRRSKELPFGGAVDEAAFRALAERVKDRLRLARLPGEVTWAADAAGQWATTEYRKLSRERFGLAGSLTSRAEAHVLRLALVYAVLDGEREIRRPHLDAALAVWDHAEKTAYRLFGTATGFPLADQIREFLRQSPKGLTRTEVSAALGRNVSSEKIGQALGLLADVGLARMERRPGAHGKTAEVWVAFG